MYWQSLGSLEKHACGDISANDITMLLALEMLSKRHCFHLVLTCIPMHVLWPLALKSHQDPSFFFHHELICFCFKRLVWSTSIINWMNPCYAAYKWAENQMNEKDGDGNYCTISVIIHVFWYNTLKYNIEVLSPRQYLVLESFLKIL